MVKKGKEKAGKIAKAPARVTTVDTPLLAEEIIAENLHAAGTMGDMSSADTRSGTMSRASRASMARMKRDMAKKDKRMDSMDTTLKAILEKLTTTGGTVRATEAMQGGEAPVAAESPST